VRYTVQHNTVWVPIQFNRTPCGSQYSSLVPRMAPIQFNTIPCGSQYSSTEPRVGPSTVHQYPVWSQYSSTEPRVGPSTVHQYPVWVPIQFNRTICGFQYSSTVPRVVPRAVGTGPVHLQARCRTRKTDLVIVVMDQFSGSGQETSPMCVCQK